MRRVLIGGEREKVGHVGLGEGDDVMIHAQIRGGVKSKRQ